MSVKTIHTKGWDPHLRIAEFERVMTLVTDLVLVFLTKIPVGTSFSISDLQVLAKGVAECLVTMEDGTIIIRDLTDNIDPLLLIEETISEKKDTSKVQPTIVADDPSPTTTYPTDLKGMIEQYRKTLEEIRDGKLWSYHGYVAGESSERVESV